MRILYVNNFRGFSNTFIPIEDVNFLVGENSTGKTSVLSLIDLLGSPGFWLSQEFNNEEVELGDFDDIVSTESRDSRSFQVGVMECGEDEGTSRGNPFAFYTGFVKQDGRPVIRNYNFLLGHQDVRIVVTPELIKYKILDLVPSENRSKTVKGVFESWIHESKRPERGFKTLSRRELPFNRRGLLILLKSMIKRILAGDETTDRELNFEVDLPSFAEGLVWVAPIRSKPLRTYDSGYRRAFSPEGEHTPYLVKDILGKERTANEFADYIGRFGLDSGLYKDIDVRRFGRQITSPFELRVSIGESKLRISNVGYGVSQSLPVIVELFARSSNSWYVIQQPEVHLHPRAQAALGNLVWTAAVDDSKRFLIETHSDFMIDRFRVCYRNGTDDQRNNIRSQVLFFERHNSGNRVHSIPIERNGEYSDQQPKSFREFFIREQMDILGL